ncbi:MAG: hypothetical protein ACO35C_07880, partial [Pontimonas sp.]
MSARDVDFFVPKHPRNVREHFLSKKNETCEEEDVETGDEDGGGESDEEDMESGDEDGGDEPEERGMDAGVDGCGDEPEEEDADAGDEDSGDESEEGDMDAGEEDDGDETDEGDGVSAFEWSALGALLGAYNISITNQTMEVLGSYATLIDRTRGCASEVHTLSIRGPSGMVTDNLQVVLLGGLPIGYGNWDAFVIERFDINVARCALAIDDIRRVGAPNAIEHSISDCITKGELECVMRPRGDFISYLRRVVKHMKKGFKLRSVTFREDCSDEHIEYIMSRFTLLFAPQIVFEMFGRWNLASEETSDIIYEHVLPFV